MATDETDVTSREELQLVDEELKAMRRTATELRQQIGDRSNGATDPAETAAAIEQAEVQEALVAAMASRRERLWRRLNEQRRPGGPP